MAKNCVHLDIKVARGLSDDERRERIEAEADHLMTAGAGVIQRVDGPEGFWVVMQDVEGNEFCVI